ncbi:MAG TPA: hypothetical protein VGQ36_28295 [Thermoanaerobaculia bacterium]|nr:hypothetical protein [Thermoanaerobaculia bacterium]
MKPRPSPPPSEEPDESTRFDRLVRALFRVDKRDVPKHEPKRRPTAPRDQSSS